LKSKATFDSQPYEYSFSSFQDFQLTYARKEWSEEKTAWRPVIFLNLIRNVNVVLSNLSNEMFDIPFNPEGSQEELESPRPARTLARIKFNEKHQQLRKRLDPLAALQRSLEEKLGSASLELQSTSVSTAAPFDQPTSSASSSYRRGLSEFSINSSNGWKSALGRLRSIRHHSSSSSTREIQESPVATVKEEVDDLEQETASTLDSVRDDIKALWEDDTVREVLTRRKIRLEDGPGLSVILLLM
jgi:guanine nucleotide-binding protein subunit alpha